MSVSANAERKSDAWVCVLILGAVLPLDATSAAVATNPMTSILIQSRPLRTFRYQSLNRQLIRKNAIPETKRKIDKLIDPSLNMGSKCDKPTDSTNETIYATSKTPQARSTCARRNSIIPSIVATVSVAVIKMEDPASVHNNPANPPQNDEFALRFRYKINNPTPTSDELIYVIRAGKTVRMGRHERDGGMGN